jgi:hypothetical protein
MWLLVTWIFAVRGLALCGGGLKASAAGGIYNLTYIW